MILFITATSEGVYYEDMSFSINDYESAFALLTQLAVEHWLVHRAVIVDATENFELPVAAFDSQPVHLQLQGLQQQWQQILSTSPMSFQKTSSRSLKELYTQFDAYYEKMLTHLRQMIWMLEMQQAKVRFVRDPRVEHRLQEQYELLLASNRRMFQQTKEKYRKNQQQLNALAG